MCDRLSDFQVGCLTYGDDLYDSDSGRLPPTIVNREDVVMIWHAGVANRQGLNGAINAKPRRSQGSVVSKAMTAPAPIPQSRTNHRSADDYENILWPVPLYVYVPLRFPCSPMNGQDSASYQFE